MRTPDKILSAMKEERAFFIAAHVNPDGDALGSALALAEALESLGKECVLYSRDIVPKQYRFMPGIGRFVHRAKEEQKRGHILVLVDCNTAERAGLNPGDPFVKSIVIDHHETEKEYGDLRWVDPSVAATGLMIYDVVKRLGIGPSKSMAVNLYTAIAVDTGTFRYGNTTADVLTTAAELVRLYAYCAEFLKRLQEIISIRKAIYQASKGQRNKETRVWNYKSRNCLRRSRPRALK